MAKTPTPAPLTPTPTALRRALAKAAERAQRLADAFGVAVPVERPRSPPASRGAAKS